MTTTRWIAAAVAAVAVVAGIVAALAALGAGSSSRSSVTPGAARQKPVGGPLLRDPNAVMLARRVGSILVGAAAVPGRVELVALASDGKRVAVRDADRCGRACFRVEAPVLRGRPLALSLELVHRGQRLPLSLGLPARAPAPAAALLAAANRTMRHLRLVRYVESLSSGAAPLRASFVLEAPDSMRYVTSAGDQAVVIGTRRWDWGDGRWQESPTQRVQQPTYIWDGAGRPRLVGRAGKLTVLGVFRPDPSYPAWFRLFVAPDRRVVRAEMLAPSHFMVDRFRGFNEHVTIRPPR